MRGFEPKMGEGRCPAHPRLLDFARRAAPARPRNLAAVETLRYPVLASASGAGAPPVVFALRLL